MGSSEILPDRSEIGDKSFSPTIDRFSILVLSVLGVLAFPEIEEMLEPSLGAISGLMTICSLIIVIPLIATSIGKMYVRIRA
jgi:hypothetical protein|tara:strand:- start:501 stop:746 length:246 start_codon:yes stop_codon:yes gene_type:complete